MSLYKNMMEACVLLEKRKTADNAGGFIVSWEDGAKFDAAIVRDTTLQARIAEKEDMRNVFTVTTSKNTKLDFHDVFRRVQDGAIFRVTSDGDDKKAPIVSTLDIAQVNAERWELTQ